MSSFFGKTFLEASWHLAKISFCFILLTLYACGGTGDSNPNNANKTNQQQAPTSGASKEVGTQKSQSSEKGRKQETGEEETIASKKQLIDGKKAFEGNCAACHGKKAEGGIGSALTNCNSCSNIDALTQRIPQDMGSFSSPCQDQKCAADIATYVFKTFIKPTQTESSSASPNNTKDASSKTIITALRIYSKNSSMTLRSRGDYQLANQKLKIIAETSIPPKEVVYTLIGPVTHTQTERRAPYESFGSNVLRSFPAGHYTLKIALKVEGTNNELVTSLEKTIPFTISMVGQSNAEIQTSEINNITPDPTKIESTLAEKNETSVINQNLEIKPDTPIFSEENYYKTSCAGCHGSQGLGGITTVSLITCNDCTSIEALAKRIISANMPSSSPKKCIGNCATKIASYIIETLKPSKKIASKISSIESFAQLSPTETLRKVALNLANRQPSEKELELVSAEGELGLNKAVDLITKDKRFCHEQLMEIYNEKLKTDLYRPREGGSATNLLDKKSFPKREWFKDIYANDKKLQYEAKQKTNEAISRQPLQLISKIACEDRPFTEILTANYMLVNSWSAQSFSVEDQVDFENPNDETEFKIARVPGYQYAGILSSNAFLSRYPSTKTNVNRARAYRTYKYFLDTDILTFSGNRNSLNDDIDSEFAEVSNPNCNGCHKILDPVARLFFNWNHSGSKFSHKKDSSDIYKKRANMFDPGFEQTKTPKSELANGLPWLAKKIVQDKRFARSVSVTLFESIMGAPTLQNSGLFDGKESDPNIASTITEQNAYINKASEKFIKSDYNLRSLAKELTINNPYYRSIGLEPNCTHSICNKLGSAQLKTPFQLDKILKSTTGLHWTGSNNNTRKPILEGTLRSMYGGIDNTGNDIGRSTQPNGLMSAIQKQMALEMGCFIASREFFQPENDRKLLRLINNNDTPDSPIGVTAIKQQLQALHQQLTGEILDTSDTEVQASFEVFKDTWGYGQTLLKEDFNKKRNLSCKITNHLDSNSKIEKNEDKLYQDPNYVIRSWAAVLSYLFLDYQFLYQE